MLYPPRSTRLPTRSTRLSTHSTPLSTRKSVCLLAVLVVLSVGLFITDPMKDYCHTLSGEKNREKVNNFKR